MLSRSSKCREIELNASVKVKVKRLRLKVKVTEWPSIGKIAAHSAYDMFHGIKCLIVGLVFSHLGFWSGNLFLIAPFRDLCLLVPFDYISLITV